MSASRSKVLGSAGNLAFWDAVTVVGGYSGLAELAAAGAVVPILGWALAAATLPALLAVTGYAIFANESELSALEDVIDALGITSSVTGTFSLPLTLMLSPKDHPLALPSVTAFVGDTAIDIIGAKTLGERIMAGARAESNLDDLTKGVGQLTGSPGEAPGGAGGPSRAGSGSSIPAANGASAANSPWAPGSIPFSLLPGSEFSDDTDGSASGSPANGQPSFSLWTVPSFDSSSFDFPPPTVGSTGEFQGGTEPPPPAPDPAPAPSPPPEPPPSPGPAPDPDPDPDPDPESDSYRSLDGDSGSDDREDE
jgi:hypothetical protein